MKDRCKLFCRVAGSTAYYQLRDRVIDGTPCGPDTNDICVQGLCRVRFLTLINFRTLKLWGSKAYVQLCGSFVQFCHCCCVDEIMTILLSLKLKVCFNWLLTKS